MNALDVLVHLLNFVAPALGTAGWLTVFSRLLFRQRTSAASMGVQFLLNALAGVAVLVLGVLLLGRDGKMLTYAALVLASHPLAYWRLNDPESNHPW